MELVVNLELIIDYKCNPSSCNVALGILKMGTPPILYLPFFAAWTCHIYTFYLLNCFETLHVSSNMFDICKPNCLICSFIHGFGLSSSTCPKIAH